MLVARRGRPAEAERKLREAIGVLERRQQYAGAARAAATLGCLLRERGDMTRAETTFERARVLFDAATRTDHSVPVSVPGYSPQPSSTHTVKEVHDVDEAIGLNGADRSHWGHGEHEDYAEAKAMLSAGGARGVLSSVVRVGPDIAPDVARQLTRAATDLFRAHARNGGLPELCVTVRSLVAADAVGVYVSGAQPTCLASAGPMPRSVAQSIGQPRQTNQRESVARPTASPVIVPIGAGKTEHPTAFLLAHWARGRPSGLGFPADALLRLASVVGAADVQGTLERESHVSSETACGIVGRSREIRDLRVAIMQQAACPYPILIEGETGSGKELVARALHHGGPRRDRVFCAVNCAALSDELFEAEFFGHARGAFTGAVAQRTGLFEEANRGTLFLDEVGELSPRAQAKLLRVVQEGEVRRLGENMTRRVDVRIMTATNRSLEKEVAAGRFRQDLLFRLAVVRLRVPPLRARGEDISLLATWFWKRALARTGGCAALGPDCLAALGRYDWPGNVRELENVMLSLSVRAPHRGWVRSDMLPTEINGAALVEGARLAEARIAFDRRFVSAALTRTSGRPGLAATELGISRQGLNKLMRRLGL